MSARLRTLGALAWKALWNFYWDDCLNLSATIAFWAVLSMGPFLYLLSFALHDLMPAGRTIVQEIATYLPSEAAPALVDLGKSLEESGALVAVAVPGLIWVGTAAFFTLEYALNVVFGTVPRRRFWLSRLKAFAGATGVVLVLVVSLLADQAAVLLDDYRTYLGLPPLLGPVGRLASYVVHLTLNFGAFVVFYKVLPRGRVVWRAAAWAAAAAVALWEGARQLFGGVLLDTPAYGLLTGTLAGMVAILLWIYTGVAVTLLAAELAALLNGNRHPPPA